MALVQNALALALRLLLNKRRRVSQDWGLIERTPIHSGRRRYTSLNHRDKTVSSSPHLYQLTTDKLVRPSVPEGLQSVPFGVEYGQAGVADTAGSHCLALLVDSVYAELETRVQCPL